MSAVFLDTSENFHPYECDGPGKCRHCDRRLEEHHDPQTCALCADTPMALVEDWDEYHGGPEVAA